MSDKSQLDAQAATRPRPSWGIIVAACLMVLFGIAEIVTSFSHTFFGITTSASVSDTVLSAAIGAIYAIAGIIILTMKKWAAALAIVLLIADIVGRIALVVTGLYPTDTPKNTFSVIAGTVIVAFFAIYIGVQWRSFQ
jgi:hypothetical protein